MLPADPEPPAHVEEFGIGPGLGGGQLGLERHAADRTAARPDLADLRVHRAGIDGAFGNRLARLARFRAEIFRRLVSLAPCAVVVVP